MSSLEHIKQIIISAFSLQTQIKKHTDILHLVFPRIKKEKLVTVNLLLQRGYPLSSQSHMRAV